jgi:transcriptional regulator with XRE-family HTH domain
MTRKQKLQSAIITAMSDYGITQAALAEAQGCTRQAVNQWLRTDKVGYDKLFDLADYVGLNVDFVISYKQ